MRDEMILNTHYLGVNFADGYVLATAGKRPSPRNASKVFATVEALGKYALTLENPNDYSAWMTRAGNAHLFGVRVSALANDAHNSVTRDLVSAAFLELVKVRDTGVAPSQELIVRLGEWLKQEGAR